jgi:hypothetical protein
MELPRFHGHFPRTLRLLDRKLRSKLGTTIFLSQVEFRLASRVMVVSRCQPEFQAVNHDCRASKRHSLSYKLHSSYEYRLFAPVTRQQTRFALARPDTKLALRLIAYVWLSSSWVTGLPLWPAVEPIMNVQLYSTHNVNT